MAEQCQCQQNKSIHLFFIHWNNTDQQPSEAPLSPSNQHQVQGDAACVGESNWTCLLFPVFILHMSHNYNVHAKPVGSNEYHVAKT